MQTGGQPPPPNYGDGPMATGAAPQQQADKQLDDFFNQVATIKVRALQNSPQLFRSVGALFFRCQR